MSYHFATSESSAVVSRGSLVPCELIIGYDFYSHPASVTLSWVRRIASKKFLLPGN